MKHRIITLAAVAASAVGLAACPSVSTGPYSALFAAESELAAADQVAMGYFSLPQCGSAGATRICWSPPVKASVKMAAGAAYAGLASARMKVLACVQANSQVPGSCDVSSVQAQAMLAVQSAMVAYQTAVANLPHS